MASDPTGPVEHTRIRVSGRVQGVYFRASAVQTAQTLGATGWVRNAADGSVEIIAEGTKQQLEALILWCRQGPAGARVDRVEIEWLSQIHGFRSFDIKR